MEVVNSNLNAYFFSFLTGNFSLLCVVFSLLLVNSHYLDVILAKHISTTVIYVVSIEMRRWLSYYSTLETFY